MRQRKTIFSRKRSYYLYFKTKSNTPIFTIYLPIMSASSVRVKLIGLSSNLVYYEGLQTDTQSFNLENNTISEEIGYYLSVKDLLTTYINLPGKNITMINLSRIRGTWSSVCDLSNNDIRTCIWKEKQLLTNTVGYNFSGNSNFTSDLLPNDTQSTNKFKVLNVVGTKVTDINFLLTAFQNLTELYIGNPLDKFEFLFPITHTKLSRFAIKQVKTNINNLMLINCPMLTYLEIYEIDISIITIDNCPLLENLNAWNNRGMLNINRTGTSKFKNVNIGLNSFTSIIKDKIINYCIDDGILNGNLAIGKTPNPPNNNSGLSVLQSRGWTGTSF
ncbi:hypothetical protein [Flavobacterium tistrianum]|uniref:hypothetical protein n=1 Tax=Flavobacterium tistrianum TaxID=1685414 RepID=UPI0013A6254A|nr:hypothetical protein [Flavobacterium tistrianum]KAF2342854.1 hypothetical protein DMB71_01735 [Flavobacterium tistrianum]